MNDNIVHLPPKTITQKYRKQNLEVWLDIESNTWKWQLVHRQPILYTGEASTCNRAIAMAKKKIDKLQEE